MANRALLQIGARTTIGSFTEGSVESDAISLLWQPTFEALARTANWDCLRKEAALAMIYSAQGTPENPNGTPPFPPYPWLYEYSYPIDCLRFQYIVPSSPFTSGGSTPQTTINNSIASWVPTQGQIPYVVMSDSISGAQTRVIVTNQDLATGVYTINTPDPQEWDSLFQQAVVSSLAVYLAPALNLSFPLMKNSIEMAEKAIILARTADGNEGVTKMDHQPDWISARAGAQGYGLSGLGFNGYYTDMIWPAFGEDGDFA